MPRPSEEFPGRWQVPGPVRHAVAYRRKVRSDAYPNSRPDQLIPELHSLFFPFLPCLFLEFLSHTQHFSGLSYAAEVQSFEKPCSSFFCEDSEAVLYSFLLCYHHQAKRHLKLVQSDG